MIWDVILLAMESPALFLRWVWGMSSRWHFYRTAYLPELICENCHRPVSLVGLWRCGCAYTYRGHLLQECPICGSVPRMVRCYHCNVTRELPKP